MNSEIYEEKESQKASKERSSKHVEEYHEYKYRFVIMVTYIGVAFTNQLLWVTCSPITTNLQKIYGVSELTVNMSALIALIVFVPAAVPGNYLLDTCGIKIGLIVGAILQLVGAWVRMFASYSFYFVLAGQFVAALAQPLLINSPQKISAYWTVPKKRTIFTTILTISQVVGSGIGFLLPGIIVGSDSSPTTGKALFLRLLLIEGIISTALSVPLFIFYRERPPTPPSASADIPRESFKKGMKSLFTNKNFIFLLTSQGIAIGNLSTLATTAESFIKPFGFTQFDASMLGILILVSGIIGSIILGLFVEKTRKYKMTVIVGNFMGMVSSGSFIGALYSRNMVVLSAVTAFTGFFIAPMLPLGLEFTCEITFPVGEAISGGAINGLSQIVALVQVFTINGIMTMRKHKTAIIISQAMLTGFMLLAFICSVLVTENLLRSKHDQSHSKKNDSDQQVIKDTNQITEEANPVSDNPNHDPNIKSAAVV